MADNREPMRAVIIEKFGKPRVLKYLRMWRPQPAAGEVLVKVQAASVNPRDFLLRSGRAILRKPMPHILGGDLAGAIEALGEGVEGWQVGERVCACFEELGCEMDGGYAEYCRVPAARLARLPDELDYQAAVGAGEAFADAWKALVVNGRLAEADTLVIRGASCSLGAAAAQIASAAGARVIVICGLEQAGQLQAVGADIALEDAGDDLARQVKLATNGAGASLVLHCSPRLDMAQSLDMLAARGRLVIAAALDKPQVKLDANEIVRKNLSIHGAQGSISVQELAALLQGIADGTYQALIGEVLPLSQARQAHQRAQDSPSLGKIVLVPDSILEAARKPANWVPIS